MNNFGQIDSVFLRIGRLLLPPILNTFVLLVVFPSIPGSIWGGLVYVVNKFEEIVHKDAAQILMSPEVQEKLLENSGEIVDAIFTNTIPLITFLIVLIFLLHKIVVSFSQVLMGKIDLIESNLDHHKEIVNLSNLQIPFLPDEPSYSTVARRWDYAKNINDAHEALSSYRSRRTKTVSLVDLTKEYAAYAKAYVMISSVAIILPVISVLDVAMPERWWPPYVIFILSLIGFVYASNKYLAYCFSLIKEDLQTFIDISYYGQSGRVDRTGHIHKKIKSKEYKATLFLDFFEGNIIRRVVDIYHMATVVVGRKKQSTQKDHTDV